MPSLFGDDHWVSGFSLVRDPRILHITDDGSMSLRPLATRPSTPPITVIVVSSSCHGSERAFATLASSHYPINIIIVGLDPETRGDVLWTPKRYKLLMPSFSSFEATRKLSVQEGMNAGLQHVTTPYFCVLGDGSMCHMDTFEYIALALAEGEYDAVLSRRFALNPASWAQFGNNTKPVWRTDYMISNGGFGEGNDSKRVADIETPLASVAGISTAKLDAVLFFANIW